MEEDERIFAFMERVNEIFLRIQCCGGSVSEDEIVSKVLRALPPAYKMKVTSINELRTMPNTSISRDTLVGKISAFELEEFGLVATIKTDLALKASSSTTSSSSSDKSDWKVLYARELEDIGRENEDLEELEALFARKMPKGRIGSKYEGKAPFKCFNYNKVGHMTSRCPDRHAILREEAKMTYKPNPEYQRYKFKKNRDNSCYYVDEGVTDDSDEEPTDNGWVFVAIKEDQLTPIVPPVEQALAAKIEEKDEWIIDSRCSHRMISDKSKFLSFQEYNGGLVRFGDDKACLIRGKGTISFDGKHNTNKVYYVEGLKHNLLSFGQLVGKGSQLQFKNGKCKIMNRTRLEIATGNQTRGNIFHLNNNEKTCLIAHIDESWLWHKRLCHVNFDCIIKISSSKAVSDLPNIVKPHNPVCKECQMGK